MRRRVGICGDELDGVATMMLAKRRRKTVLI
jgi:hypothetical protein